MKLKKRWMAIFLSFVLMCGLCMGEIQTAQSKSNYPADISKKVTKKKGKAPTITLNSGYKMPVLGLGTYSLKDEVCVNSVMTALKTGVRKIDTAYIYDNEESVGEGIRKSGVPREEIFVTTKLYINQYNNAEKAIDDALKRLDLEYIDLMLLHHPGDNDVKAYKAMEKAVKQGNFVLLDYQIIISRR